MGPGWRYLKTRLIISMIKLVAFDWNGVLIADAAHAAASVSKVLEHLGKGSISVKEYRELFTIPAKHIYLKRGMTEAEDETNANTIQEMFHKDYEPRIAKVRTRTGARKLLDFLFKRSVEMIVISNHTVEGVNFQIERLGLQKYFSNVFARDAKGSWASRSKLERLQKFLGQRSFLPKEIVIIGDSPEEVEVGKHLGLHTIAITGGFCSAKRLKEARPNYLIHNLTEMIEIINKL